MCLDSGPKRQSGAGLPIALFIITVLSLIVVGMSQLQESSGNAISLQVQSQRAFYAAESGAQLVIANLLKEAGDDDLFSCPSPGVEEDIAFDRGFSASGLSGCRAIVRTRKECKGNAGRVVVNSEGSCGAPGSIDRAQRTVEVRLR